MDDTFLTVWNQTEHTIHFKHEVFGDFVLMVIVDKNYTCSCLRKEGDYDHTPDYKKGSKTSQWSFVISKTLFDKKINEFGSDPNWILNIERFGQSTESIEEAVHPDWLAAYKGGRYWEYTHHSGKKTKPRYTTTSLIDILKEGKTELLLIDRTSDDGFFYDLNRNRVMRNFFFDYCALQIKSKNYMLKKLLESISKHPQVLEPKIITLPHYNASFEGEKALEFGFKPKDQEEFDMLAGLKKFDSTCTKYIKDLLNVESFRKESEDD